MSALVGVDEVGRGPLAGPVVTCAVLWPDDHGISELNDSKKISAKKREALIPLIRDKALQISFGRAEVEEIDTLNILNATMLAMERAVAGLNEFDAPIRIDGNRVPNGLKQRAQAVVGGDGLVAAISAASILAKVARDEEMAALAEIYPGYGFEGHAGYPTRAHIEALDLLGISPIHRRSFGPVKRILEKV
ncbi:MAG: ribonuclease HII [Pseudomonadota bacterium]|nr:ribonuclease HII [Pseudomonadota bacterium]MEE2820529.1 ribonuclease HII [Pseudomonadota bacterium]